MRHQHTAAVILIALQMGKDASRARGEYKRTMIKTAGLVEGLGGAALKGLGAMGRTVGGAGLRGAGSALGTAGRFAGSNPMMTGAIAGGAAGGMFGPNGNHSMSGTLRNITLGAGAGAMGGQYFSPQMARLGGMAMRPAGSMFSAGNTMSALGRQMNPGVANWTQRGLNAGNTVLGWKTGMGPGAVPFMLGGGIGGMEGAHQGAQEAQNQIAERGSQVIPEMMANVPFQQRLMYLMNPGMMRGQLTPQMIQQMMQGVPKTAAMRVWVAAGMPR